MTPTLSISRLSSRKCHVIFRGTNIKQLLDEVFRDIQNYQGRGLPKCYQPKPKVEAENTYRDLDNSGYHKKPKARKNTSKEQNVHRYYMLNHTIRYLLFHLLRHFLVVRFSVF